MTATQLPEGLGLHRVIVVDDEFGARLQVELALMTSSTCQLVGKADNGMRGAELAERVQPDVVVIDLSMPVMDGFEAIPLIRTVSPHSRILVRSNTDEPGDIQRALQLGAQGFVRKMLSPDTLRSAIEQACPSDAPHGLLALAATGRGRSRHPGRRTARPAGSLRN